MAPSVSIDRGWRAYGHFGPFRAWGEACRIAHLPATLPAAKPCAGRPLPAADVRRARGRSTPTRRFADANRRGGPTAAGAATGRGGRCNSREWWPSAADGWIHRTVPRDYPGVGLGNPRRNVIAWATARTVPADVASRRGETALSPARPSTSATARVCVLTRSTPAGPGRQRGRICRTCRPGGFALLSPLISIAAVAV